MGDGLRQDPSHILIGATADRYRNFPVYAILLLLRWTGLAFCEVTTSLFRQPRLCRSVTRGMHLGLHLPNLGNCGYDFSSRDRLETITSDLDAIRKYGSLFDIRYAVFHPPEADKSPDVFPTYVRSLKRVGLPLVLENIQGYSVDSFGAFYNTLRHELGDDLTGICLDIPHAVLSDHDWTEFFHAFQSEIRVIHLTDCRGEADSHLPFGLGGDLDLEEILTFIQEEEYSGVLNFEMMPPGFNALDAYFGSIILARERLDPSNLVKSRKRIGHVLQFGRILNLLKRDVPAHAD